MLALGPKFMSLYICKIAVWTITLVALAFYCLLIISVMDSGSMMVPHTICNPVYRLLFTMLHTYFSFILI